MVAADLLGRLLVRREAQGTLVGRIVECEAYQEDDPASHSYRGRTARTEVMFGMPGRLYVYFTYGMHFCMNVVTDAPGRGSAVLLRAVEPLEGLDVMRVRRGVEDARSLCRGPARLTQSYGIGREGNGLDLVGARGLFVAGGEPLPAARVGVGPRVGIRLAADRPWRFFEVGSPYVSRARGGPGSGRRRG
jgi:DNA-3-methyladenine glycosylase